MKLTNLARARLRNSFAIAGLAVLLSSCGGGGVCTGWGPIYIDPQDKFTDRTAKQILKHDEYGASLKCAAFKPKGGWF